MSKSKKTTSIKKNTAAKQTKAKRLSALDAAAKVLGESKKPMNTQALIKTMADRKLWTSPGGKTPHATLHAALSREIRTMGKAARFTKAERGLFAAAKGA